MKKTVIKRRKRVPAAGGVTTGRMTDQAAAEALVAVGRGNIGGGDESDGETVEPRKKRARRGRSEKEKRREEEDVTMEGTEEETERTREKLGRGARGLKRRRSRESNGSNWDGAGTQGENGHGHGMNGSPPLDHQQRAHSLSRLPGGEYAHLQRSSSHGQYVGSPHPHPHGGFDLPPLNAALGVPGSYAGYSGSLLSGSRDGHYPGAPSSYIRSGSSAPSRTHSPLNPAGAATAPGYALPPHGIPHPHAHGLYYSQPTGLSPLHSHSPPPHPPHESMNGSGIPTYGDLKRHYDELHDHRKKLEEMMEKNDRMIAGVKRGLDEMRAGGVHPPQSQSNVGGAPPPLMRDSDRPRSRASVWPVDSGPRD